MTIVVSAKVPEGVVRPTGIPASYEEHIKLMGDLFVLAFQTDITRIATFVVAVKNYGNAATPAIHPYIDGTNNANQSWHADGSQPASAADGNDAD